MSEIEIIFIKFMMKTYMLTLHTSVIAIAFYVYIWICTEIYVREMSIKNLIK